MAGQHDDMSRPDAGPLTSGQAGSGGAGPPEQGARHAGAFVVVGNPAFRPLRDLYGGDQEPRLEAVVFPPARALQRTRRLLAAIRIFERPAGSDPAAPEQEASAPLSDEAVESEPDDRPDDARTDAAAIVGTDATDAAEPAEAALAPEAQQQEEDGFADAPRKIAAETGPIDEPAATSDDDTIAETPAEKGEAGEEMAPSAGDPADPPESVAVQAAEPALQADDVIAAPQLLEITQRNAAFQLIATIEVGVDLAGPAGSDVAGQGTRMAVESAPRAAPDRADAAAPDEPPEFDVGPGETEAPVVAEDAEARGTPDRTESANQAEQAESVEDAPNAQGVGSPEDGEAREPDTAGDLADVNARQAEDTMTTDLVPVVGRPTAQLGRERAAREDPHEPSGPVIQLPDLSDEAEDAPAADGSATEAAKGSHGATAQDGNGETVRNRPDATSPTGLDAVPAAPENRAPVVPLRPAPTQKGAVARQGITLSPAASVGGKPKPVLVADNDGLAADGLGKRFKQRQVLRGVSLNVQRGEVVGLLGPNGAGKTTCFYIITGLISADYGSISLDGQDITGLPMYRRARMGIGYLPQEPSIFRGLSVEANIRSVLESVEPDRETREARLDELLAEFSITHLRRTPALALSGGERRRVEIARSLASRPNFILLDEPLAGIDPIALGDIRDLVAHLKDRGIGVLITDHNVRETLEIVDRAYIIYNGEVLMSGQPADIVAHDDVRRVYLGDGFTL